MPSRHVIKQYAENSYYHVYNRGVEKRAIFLDKQDYAVFLYYLFVYLAPADTVLKHYPKLNWNLRKNNLSQHIEIVCYCLMPNHFHFLVRQKDSNAMTKLVRQLTNGYTRYFNEKYDRVGSLFQGPFKAALIETDSYLLHLSRYIHRNILDLPEITTWEDFEHYPWSSYQFYIGKTQSSYVSSRQILDFFSQKEPLVSYKNFVRMSDLSNPLPDDYLFEH